MTRPALDALADLIAETGAAHIRAMPRVGGTGSPSMMRAADALLKQGERLRAALDAADEWQASGVTPPPNALPRLPPIIDDIRDSLRAVHDADLAVVARAEREAASLDHDISQTIAWRPGQRRRK